MMNSARPNNGNGKIRSIVFDFDGTLAELLLDFALMKSNLGTLVEKYLPGPVAPPSLPALEWLEELATAIGHRDGTAAEDFRREAHRMISEMEMEAAHHGRLFSFTRPLLTELRQLGLSAAIITRNCERAVRLVFPDLEDYCRAFLARDHVPLVKPHPDHLLRALDAMGSDSATSMMVGDHPLDIRTGKNAGILTAGVATGKTTPGELSRSGAHWTANNCMDLFRELKAAGWI